MKHLIYFDNAATTFPKPISVVRAVEHCMEDYCGNPGRSGHRLSLEASRKIYDCRELLSDMFGISSPTNIVFTMNTTYALNIAINALLTKGSHILISDLEHNSVLRTVASQKRNGSSYDIFKVYPGNDEATLRSLKSKLRPDTSLVVCTHQSNICGVRLPIEKIGKICNARRIRFIVDAAQSAGYHPIRLDRCHIDAVCCPGHKGLYGPQGTGFAVFSDKYSAPEFLNTTLPFLYGGNGVNSADIEMPDFLPERFEAGTLPTPAIAGLCEGIKFVNNQTYKKIAYHSNQLYQRAFDMLSSMKNVRIYYPFLLPSSTILFNADGYSSDYVADHLNKYDICVRSGLHCAPLAHKKLNTLKCGAVRVSYSFFNTQEENEQFYRALKSLI